MRERTPSQTAMLVAFARALADSGLTTVPHFEDPVAKELLSRGWWLWFQLISRRIVRSRRSRRKQGVARLDAIALRVKSIDAEVEAAIADGCRQFVLLGAGLDTRAHRLKALRDVDVFEVDHPATQMYKTRRARDLPRTAKSITYVAVNFEQEEAIATKLREAGFRADVRTVWVWEGVVMYLTDRAIAETLDAVAQCSAKGSVLVVNYHEPGGAPDEREERRRRTMLKLWGEPMIGERTREKMRAEVTRAGFAVLRDLRITESAERFGAREPKGYLAEVARLLVATR